MSLKNYLWDKMVMMIDSLPKPLTISHNNVEGHREEVELISKTQTIRYKIGKSKYYFPFSDFYIALTKFDSQLVNSDDLIACAKSFKQKGCHCATFFLLLHTMGIVDDIIKTGPNNRQLEVQL